MTIVIVLLMQVGLAEAPPALAGFDLRDLPTRRGAGCDEAASRLDDIVICARGGDRSFDEDGYTQELLLPRAEMAIEGARLSVDAEQVELSRGEVSQRAMLRLKIPF